jgi:endonuclease/exonuclease/phosphatase family metal-dependent hydrolase
MMSPSRRRWLMRIWIALSFIMFFATCADRIRPYLKSIAGARDGGAAHAPTREQPRAQTKQAHGLRLASWNLHFLDVEGHGHDHRARADYEALQRYADGLDADVIAVQEVANEAALALVFSPRVYAYHLAGERGVQRTGFVYKRSLHARVMPDVNELALRDLRAGSDLVVRVAGKELRLLSVHLKAFCVKGPLTRLNKDCQKLREQVPVLEAWIDSRARERVPFVVLGDFNRVLSADGDELFADLNDGDPKELSLSLASRRTQSNCFPGKHKTAIDHVLLGGAAGHWLSAAGLTEAPFGVDDVSAGRKLSDHCPISITLAPTMR